MNKRDVTFAHSAVLISLLLFGLAGVCSAEDFNYIANPPRMRVGSGVVPDGIPYCGSQIICYSPNFVRTAYNFPSNLDGTGQTILIVDAFGSPTIQNDLAVFDSIFGLPDPASFTILCPDGCPSSSFNNKHYDVLGWAFETTLDVEYAHAIAPGANIVLEVAATSTGNAINVAEAKAIQLYPGSIMSQSFGIPEILVHRNSSYRRKRNYQAGGRGRDYRTGFCRRQWCHQRLQHGQRQLPRFRSSSHCRRRQPKGIPIYPLAPRITALPTKLVTLASLQSWIPALRAGFLLALARPSATAASRSGTRLYSTPAQPPGVRPVSSSSALVPERAGLEREDYSRRLLQCGNQRPGVDLHQLSGCSRHLCHRGTSAGSPQWASIFALVNQCRANHSLGPLGFANPAIYSFAGAGFHDITVGNNKMTGTPAGFTAAAGWDDATGWGTPIVANLVPGLAGTTCP